MKMAMATLLSGCGSMGQVGPTLIAVYYVDVGIDQDRDKLLDNGATTTQDHNNRRKG